MKILGENFNKDQFRNYVAKYDFGSIPPDSIVVHHTWSPTKKDWKGNTTLMGIKNYYESKGWNSSPHLFVAEDGVWTMTAMNKVGIHAGKGNAHYKWGRLKGYSIGIEVVGDYDAERWSGKTKSNALACIRILQKRLNIPNDKVFFHRDFSSKSCPGHAITKEWLFKELAKRDAEGARTAQNLSVVSEWAKDAWAWQLEEDLDRHIHPHTKVDAEWVFAILKKLNDKYAKNQF